MFRRQMAWLGVPATTTALERLAAGCPALTIAELGDTAGLEPGRPLRFLDPHGEVVGSAIADPENGVVHVLARQALRALDATFFRGRLEPAWALRRALGLVDGVSAYRLINGEGDALPGLWADIYGPYAVIGAASGGLLPLARQLGAVVLEDGGVRGVVLKVRGKDPQDRSLKDEVLGESPPAKLVVQELGIPYEVHLLGSLNVGLFCDMREHRRGIGRFVAGRRVLNTFAYTGALSVAAARAGATAVTSVDLSSGVLAWARENFRLSGYAEDDSRLKFVVSDVRRFMEKEKAAAPATTPSSSTRPPCRRRGQRNGR
jgi:23S rRNA (cytosine1962-C5)-methyltransferase